MLDLIKAYPQLKVVVQDMEYIRGQWEEVNDLFYPVCIRF